MPNRQNPCMAAAISATRWYNMLNGKTKMVVQLVTIVTAIVFATIAIEGRYAKAGDVKSIESSVNGMVAAMTIQQVTRQTVLQLKAAAGTITPEEQVELDGITKVLQALQK